MLAFSKKASVSADEEKDGLKKALAYVREENDALEEKLARMGRALAAARRAAVQSGTGTPKIRESARLSEIPKL